MKTISDGVNSKLFELSRASEKFKISESVRRLTEITQKIPAKISCN